MGKVTLKLSEAEASRLASACSLMVEMSKLTLTKMQRRKAKEKSIAAQESLIEEWTELGTKVRKSI